MFRHKGLKEIFETGKSKLIPPDTRNRIAARLDVLDAARTIAGVNAPGFDLHPLKAPVRLFDDLGDSRRVVVRWVRDTVVKLLLQHESSERVLLEIEEPPGPLDVG